MKNTNDSANKGLYKRLLLRGVLAAAGVIGVIFLLPRLVHMLFPFVIAFLVAAFLNPLVSRINRTLGASRRVIALILDLLVFLVVAGLVGWLVYAVASETIALATSLQMNWDNIVAKLDGLEEGFAWLINVLPPQITDLLAGFEESVITFVQNIGKDLLSTILSATTAFTTKTGNIVINFVIAMLAGYFIIADYNSITAAMKRCVGKKVCGYLSILRSSALTAVGGYMKSQLLLALFAFIVMFAALGIYGQPYALVIALFLGFIDLLPIVGTIAVLLPWGVIEWFGGDMNKGIFLVILGVAFFLVRKVVEPKIVGSQTGLHPLAALMSTYVGLQFSGVWGAVLGPVVLMLVISIVKSGLLDGTIADLKAAGANLSNALAPRDTSKNELDDK